MGVFSADAARYSVKRLVLTYRPVSERVVSPGAVGTSGVTEIHRLLLQDEPQARTAFCIAARGDGEGRVMGMAFTGRKYTAKEACCSDMLVRFWRSLRQVCNAFVERRTIRVHRYYRPGLGPGSRFLFEVLAPPALTAADVAAIRFGIPALLMLPFLPSRWAAIRRSRHPHRSWPYSEAESHFS